MEKQKKKKNVTIFDDSLVGIELNLWGEFAYFEFQKDSVIVIKDVMVGEFNQIKNFTSIVSTNFLIDIDRIPEALQLQKWLKMNKNKEIVIEKSEANYSLINWSKLEENCNKNLNEVGDKIYSDIEVRIMHIKMEPLYYEACPNDKCNRKVFEDSDQYRCESCNMYFPQPKARYIFTAKITDNTGSGWVTFMDQVGSQALGRPAEDFRSIKINDPENYEEKWQSFVSSTLYKECRLKIVSKMETYAGETRTKHQVVQILPYDIEKDNKKMLDQLLEYLKKNS